MCIRDSSTLGQLKLINIGYFLVLAAPSRRRCQHRIHLLQCNLIYTAHSNNEDSNMLCSSQSISKQESLKKSIPSVLLQSWPGMYGQPAVKIPSSNYPQILCFGDVAKLWTTLWKNELWTKTDSNSSSCRNPWRQMGLMQDAGPVSYTHLTLPTILRV